MNLLTEEKWITDLKTNLWLPKGTGSWEGWTEGLAQVHSSLWNDWPKGTCCIAWGTLPTIL